MSFNKILNPLLTITAIAFSLLTVSCGKDPVAVEPDPVFLVTGVPITLQDNTGAQFPGVAFYATPDVDVAMTKVIIKNPLNQEVATFNCNNTLFVKNTAYGCQDANTGYAKLGGDWTLTFVGKINTSGKNFSVDKKITVSAK